MENRPKTGRLIFLGNPSPWLKQFLGALQQTGSFDIQTVATLAEFLSTPVPKNRVSILLFENNLTSRENFSALKASGRRVISLWIGKTFSKEDVVYALENRVYALLENPDLLLTGVVDTLRRAMERAENWERAEDLSFSIKSVLLQMGQEGASERLLGELKTGLAKFERHAMQSEYVTSVGSGSGGETRLPFYKSQAIADALLTIEDLARTGTLTIQAKGNEKGRVDFLQGRPVSAVSGEALALKAMYRMFLWDEPEFTFHHRDASEMLVKDQFPLSLREICAEGEGLRARFEKIRGQLPPAQLKLELVPASLHKGTALDRIHFSTLSSVVELGKVSQILDYNLLPDAVLYECLIGLKKTGMIKVRL